MISLRVRDLLDAKRVPYEVLEHREAYTAQGVAASIPVSGWCVAKVVLLRDARGGHLMAVLPASCNVDLARLRSVSGRPDLTFATEEEMNRLFPDCATGAIPPFGRLYGIPVFVDSCFPHAKEIVFQAGNHHEVVRMSYALFETLAGPDVADFCCH